MIAQVHPLTHTRSCYFGFQLIYHDIGMNRMSTKVLGTVCNLRDGPDDELTLDQCGFTTGDYLSVKLAFLNHNSTPSTRGAYSRRVPSSYSSYVSRPVPSLPDHWEPHDNRGPPLNQPPMRRIGDHWDGRNAKDRAMRRWP